MNRMARRPPRLHQIYASYPAPLFFVTFGTFNRNPVLAFEALHMRFVAFGKRSEARGIAIGKYVILPDHIHLMLRLSDTIELGPTIGFLKRSLSTALNRSGIPQPHWQPGFFDRLIRSGESAAEKWEYVDLNPVRAGLAQSPEQWPYRGEILTLDY